jgi:ATP-dependent DNA helicase RecG
MQDQPLTDLMAFTGRKDRTKFRNQVLTPLLAAGLLELTIPDKPRSSKQRYRLTGAGAEYLKKSEEGK